MGRVLNRGTKIEKYHCPVWQNITALLVLSADSPQISDTVKQL
jgi:hypothetical protein